MNPFARNWGFEHSFKTGIKNCFANSSWKCFIFVGASSSGKFSPDFDPFAVAFGGMLGYYFLSDSKFSFWWLLGVGVFFRVSTFFFAPQWSEDGVRFCGMESFCYKARILTS